MGQALYGGDDQVVDAILTRYGHFSVELGLERIQRLLANLGNPQQLIPIVHVAGSNGKGSVCAYLSAVLTHAGYRVGRYTSPHLVSWCERICINQEAIAPAEFVKAIEQAQAAINPEAEPPTQFELVTAAAWLYFAEQQVDIAVIEVGLGGRLDATNVCDRPLVSVITSLSREHWQRLGPTLSDIAREKAGILKSGCPAVIGPLPPDAEAVVKQRLSELNCPAIWPKPAQDLGDGTVAVQGLRYSLALPGGVQLTNSAIAITTLKLLQQQGWNLSDEVITAGMAKTTWPGRLQWSRYQGNPLLIDGAHNPAGAIALRQYVDQLETVKSGQPVNWVVGMIGTKDHKDVFQEILRPGDRLYLAPVPEHLPADLNQMAQMAQEVCPDLASIEIYETVFAALEAAMRSPGLHILSGSLYLIGHFMKHHRGYAYAD